MFTASKRQELARFLPACLGRSEKRSHKSKSINVCWARSLSFNRSVCFRVFETNGLQIYTTPINYATEHEHRFVWTSIELLEPSSRLCRVLDISVAFSLARRMFLLKLKLEEICQWSLSSVHKRSDRGVSCSSWGRHASIKSLLADPLVRSCALWTTVLK